MSWGSAAFVALWVAHAAMNVYGLTGVWSKTYMEYYVAGKLGSADAPEQVLLYKSTFWDNVKQFWQSEAEAVAVMGCPLPCLSLLLGRRRTAYGRRPRAPRVTPPRGGVPLAVPTAAGALTPL